MKQLYNTIKQDPQIKKFCAYGFLKNLTFFQPYLLIYLLGSGLNLFEIGILYSIREGITYIFEIPSGVIADLYGKKRELMICFLFYIISFILFFIGGHFFIFTLAMLLFGLGEAFRSGTHKGMILSYLEQKEWFDHKTFVYGRTRSFSLLGSSISAFLSILLVLNLPAMRWLFLLCVIPYILDFLLIYSYPENLNEPSDIKFSVKKFLKEIFSKIFTLKGEKKLTKTVLNAALFEGFFRSLKDYIQPILAITLVTTVTSDLIINPNDHLKITLGIVYGIYFIMSSQLSQKIYLIVKKYPAEQMMNGSFFALSVSLMFLGIGIYFNSSIIIILIYFILYLMKDGRRPLFLQIAGDLMKKSDRVTILSIETQIRSLSIIIMAPPIGWLAVHSSLEMMLLIVGGVALLCHMLLRLKTEPKTEEI